MNLTSKIWTRSNKFHSFFREGNTVADTLANIGVVEVDRIVYFDGPSCQITNLLHDDIVGVAFPRFVV